MKVKAQSCTGLRCPNSCKVFAMTWVGVLPPEMFAYCNGRYAMIQTNPGIFGCDVIWGKVCLFYRFGAGSHT